MAYRNHLPRRNRSRRTALAFGGLLLTLPSAVGAAGYDDRPALSRAALAGIRGGFVTVGGLEINVGLDVRSFVDGTPVLHTSLTPADPARTAAAPIVRLTAGDDATTRIVQRIDAGQHLTALTNRVDNRVIEQVTTLTVDIANFRAVTAQFPTRQWNRLDDLVRGSLRDTLN